jgi:hypothetical protein
MSEVKSLCYKCKKEYNVNNRTFSYSKNEKKKLYLWFQSAFICNNCYTLIALCCSKSSLIDRCTVVRNYSKETKDIRDSMSIVRKLGVGRGDLKTGLELFLNQTMEQMFISPIVTLIYEYVSKKKIHLDLLSEYYKSNGWYCHRCGKTHNLHDD